MDKHAKNIDYNAMVRNILAMTEQNKSTIEIAESLGYTAERIRQVMADYGPSIWKPMTRKQAKRTATDTSSMTVDEVAQAWGCKRSTAHTFMHQHGMKHARSKQ